MSENIRSNQESSPEIIHFEWGLLRVKGDFTGKDAKLFPGGVEEWDWNKTNTRHVPGIQPADVKELLERNAKIVILSRGVHDKLQVSEETRQMIVDCEKSGEIQFFIENTKEAVERYNKLAGENKLVGALIHTTC